MRNLLLSLLLTATHLVATAAPCPDKVPEGLTAVPVGSDVVTNGLSMSIIQVTSKDEVADILARVEAKWSAAGHDVKRSVTAGWMVVSAKGKGCLVTLQLADRNGVFGYLTRGEKVTTVLTAAKMGIALPRDAVVSSSVASKDDGRRGLVLAMTSSREVDGIRDFFIEKLTDQNWKAVRVQKINDGRSGRSMQFLSAQRGKQQVEIVIWREQASQIVMTVSDAL